VDSLVGLYGIGVLAYAILLYTQNLFAGLRRSHHINCSPCFDGCEVKDASLTLDGSDQIRGIDDVEPRSWKPQGIDGKVILVAAIE
jgi:hypothetical protein